MRRTITRIWFICLGLVALAACERSAAPPPAPPKPVTPAEELGGFDASIVAIDFWAHPTLAFNGMVLTLSGGDLAAFNIEDGVEVARLPTSADRLAVGYDGRGLSANGLTVTVGGKDGGEDGVSFFAIDNISRALKALTDNVSALLAPVGLNSATIANICLGKNGKTQQLTLYLLGDETLSSLPLSIEGDVVSASGLQSRPAPAGLTHCAVDAIDGAVFATSENGKIYRFGSDETEPETFANAQIEKAAGLDLSFSGLTTGGPTEECCGQLGVIDAASGVLHIFDRDDGASLGTALVGESFDIDATSNVTAMAVGSGNFGGTLRNGVLAVATTDANQEPVVRFAPWSGVLNALEAPFGDSLSPRGEDEIEDSGVTIDLNILTNP